MKGHRPKALSFPEDPLIQSYMARHPEAKLVPISLSGDEPAPARAFAMRQLQLIQVRRLIPRVETLTVSVLGEVRLTNCRGQRVMRATPPCRDVRRSASAMLMLFTPLAPPPCWETPYTLSELYGLAWCDQDWATSSRRNSGSVADTPGN